MANNSVKNITLNSSDGEEFKVPEVVVMESQRIRHMIKDDKAENSIPLPEINSKILSKVIEYCKKHVNAASKATVVDLKNWDAEFMKMELGTLFDLILAADFLKINGLLDLTCQTAADMIKGFTPDEIRKTFNIKNVFSPEEEEKIRRENQWAFE